MLKDCCQGKVQYLLRHSAISCSKLVCTVMCYYKILSVLCACAVVLLCRRPSTDMGMCGVAAYALINGQTRVAQHQQMS
jgi:hypothetical protein